MRPLYPHQCGPFRYTLAADHPALFMEMRLGKTLLAVRRAKLYRPRAPALGLRVLVAAPSSALGSWEREAEAEGLEVVWLMGTKAKRRAALANAFSQGLRRSLFVLINREGWIALPEIAAANWDAVILDESAFIKNPRARVTKFFLRNFRNVPHRWALTGTPNPEGEENYFCQLAWLWGSALGCKNYWQFRTRFMRPHPAGWGWMMKAGASDTVRREVGRRCVVMRRRDVGVERRKVFERRDLELSEDAKQCYATAEDDFILRWQEEETDRTFCAAAVWQWLRQLAGGFIDGKMVWPGKINEVLELAMGELRRERFVVWCCYTAEVNAIREALNAIGVRAFSLQGSDSLTEREARRKAFGRGDARALVLQQQVAQTGMDLSAADTAIYFSTPPGQLARVQTEDRILSLQKGGPLLYLDLVTKNTVDVDVLKTLQSKERLTQASLNRALAVAMRERLSWTRR